MDTGKKVITGSEVFEKVASDPRYASLSPEVLEHARPDIEALATINADRLDQPLTLTNLLSACVDYMEYQVRRHGDFLGMYSVVIAQVRAMLDDLPAFLASEGFTEDQIILGPLMGLNPAMRELYMAGTLTIGDLLENQPVVFLPENALFK